MLLHTAVSCNYVLVESLSKSRPQTRLSTISWTRISGKIFESKLGLVLETLYSDACSRIRDYLNPLAIGANILQAPDCSFDKVLLLLRNLFHFYIHLPDEDQLIRHTVISSLERH